MKKAFFFVPYASSLFFDAFVTTFQWVQFSISSIRRFSAFSSSYLCFVDGEKKISISSIGSISYLDLHPPFCSFLYFLLLKLYYYYIIITTSL